VNEIMEKIANYMKKREFSVNNIMKSFSSSATDRVADWWEAVQECSKSDWNCSIIDHHSPYAHLLNLSLTHHSFPNMPTLVIFFFFFFNFSFISSLLIYIVSLFIYVFYF